MSSAVQAPAIGTTPATSLRSDTRRGDRADTRPDLAFLTWVPRERMPGRLLAEQAYEEILGVLEETGDVILLERIFGRLDVAGDVLAARDAVRERREAAPAPAPTFVEGAPFGDEDLAGIHVVAAHGAAGPGRLLVRSGQVCGRVVRTRGGEILSLSDPGRLVEGRGLTPEAETREVFRAASALLAEEGWSFGDVGRTWFYLRDILGWYGAFNRARNDEFRRLGLLGGGPSQGLIPASTGIEGRSARGAACALDLIAARRSGDGPFAMTRLANVRQNEATEYGSAFARGMALTLGIDRYVLVSGTASIDDHGASVYAGDFEAQVRRTLETVESLLAGAGASMRDVVQATAFVKRAEDVGAFRRLAEAAGLSSVPPVSMLADVCREELLFELDATAIGPRAAEAAPAADAP